MIALVIFAIVIIATLTVFSVIKSLATAENVSEYDLQDYNTILKFKPFILAGIFVALGVIAVFNSIYFTNEQETGFVSCFSENTKIEGAGMHFKMPFFAKAHVFDGTTLGMPIGYSEENNESVKSDSEMITSDFNLVNIDFYVEYRISDPIAYYYCTSNPEQLLRNIVKAASKNTVGLFDVDSVFTTGKAQIEAQIFESIIDELSKHDLGLTVENISIQDVEAPTADVNNSFKAVEDAKQQAATKKNQAQSYTNEQIPAAEASAAKVLASAEATKTERVNQATEEVATFEALYSEYSKNPEVVKHRMYLDTLSELLPNMEIIIGEDTDVLYVTSGDENVTVNPILPQKDAQEDN